MRRRALLLGILGWGLGACGPLTAPSARSMVAPGQARAGEGPAGRAEAGPRATEEQVELEVKPVGEGRTLARQTGHCDLGGVVAAHGSRGLASRACERDVSIEKELAHGLRMSVAAHVQNEGRQRHLAGDIEQARLDYRDAIRRDNEGRALSAVTHLARINLGLLLHEQGEHEEASAHLRWVLEHSSDPTVRGAAYHNLSLVLLAQADTDAALEAAQRGLQLLRNTQGASHGSVGASLDALGVIHAERGELDEAILSLEAAIEARVAALGDEHPATAASHTNLGVALGRRGDWEAALRAHREALAIDRTVLGPKHAVTAADHAHVGAALLALGQPQPARESFHEALAILEPTRPADDVEVQQLRDWLVACEEAEAPPHDPPPGSPIELGVAPQHPRRARLVLE